MSPKRIATALAVLAAVASASGTSAGAGGGSEIAGNDRVVTGTQGDDSIDVVFEASAVVIVREGVPAERYEASALVLGEAGRDGAVTDRENDVRGVEVRRR